LNGLGVELEVDLPFCQKFLRRRRAEICQLGATSVDVEREMCGIICAAMKKASCCEPQLHFGWRAGEIFYSFAAVLFPFATAPAPAKFCFLA
jgi:hypothetical protein